MKIQESSKVSLWAIFIMLLMLPCLSYAEDYPNVAFKKNVPPELRQKFPVCDEFLDVKWIDPERHVGRMKATHYHGDKYNGTPYLLVLSNHLWTPTSVAPRPYITYEITEKEYLSKEFDAFIRKAVFRTALGDYLLFAEEGGRERKFQQTVLAMHNWTRNLPHPTDSLAGHTKNICLIQPKGDVAVVAEDKQPFYQTPWNEALQRRYEAFLKATHTHCEELIKKETQLTCDYTPVEFGTSIDIDIDGREDYVSGFYLNIDRPRDGRKYILISGSSKFVYIPRRCSVGLNFHPFSYNAAERSLYYGPCNLTEMSKGGKDHATE